MPLALHARQMWAPRHPFFRHARARAWIAVRDGIAVGRISAQIDELQQQQGRPGAGQFGQLEAVDDIDVFAALVDQAGQWLSSAGMRTMSGPFDLSINQQCGLLVDGFEHSPMMMMGYAHPYYRDHLQALGFQPVADLLAYRGRPDFTPPPVMQRMLKRLGNRIRIETVQRSGLEEKAELMRSIFNEAWAGNWGFVPMTRDEFAHTVSEMKLLVRPGYVNLAWFDDEPAAFMVTLPDLNEMIRDLDGRLLPFGAIKLIWRIWRKQCRNARVPLMGVVARHQQSLTGAGLSYALMAATLPHMIADGIELSEQSWILEQNRGMRSLVESIGMQVAQRFQILERPLASGL